MATSKCGRCGNPAIGCLYKQNLSHVDSYNKFICVVCFETLHGPADPITSIYMDPILRLNPSVNDYATYARIKAEWMNNKVFNG